MDYDVIVVGGGNAAFAAAVSARENGAKRVLVLEKGSLVFDGPTDEGIKFLHYDGDDDEPDSEESSEDERDDALANDI